MEQAADYLQADMSLLFAEYNGQLTAIYKDLKDMKRQNKFQIVFRPGRSRQGVSDDVKHTIE
jgi:hypothetical protein